MLDDLPGEIWLDGRLIPWKDARVHIMVHGLHYASTVFEGIMSYNGKVLRSQDHYERLFRSAEYLGFTIPYAVEELVKATEQLVLKQGYASSYIRPIAWCGAKTWTISTIGCDVHVAITAREKTWSTPEHFYTKGLRMVISDWRRPDPNTAPVQAKAAGLYIISSLSKNDAIKRGFDDALMLSYKGNIAEATVSNIFFVIAGKLYTPIPDCFLNGITRIICLELAKQLNIEAHETYLTIEDLDQVEEAFLTGTATEILPIQSIEGVDNNGRNRFWQFKSGPVTTSMISEFHKMIETL